MARIKPGDLVLFYHDANLQYLRRVMANGDFQCHKGRLPWQEIYEKEYGSEIKTHMGFKFHLLHPSIADSMMGVKRRTTIAYPKDVGYMLLRASIYPGIKVAEVGSGSGALTSVLAKYVQPHGRVFSFERRPEFSKNSLQNVERLGLAEFVNFDVRDVALQGFGVKDIDVCVVDVPEPWTIAPHAAQALCKGGRWVSLNPSTEQLQETRRALETLGFKRFSVWEIMLREMYIRPQGSRPKERMIGHTVYMAFADYAPEDSNSILQDATDPIA